MTDQQPLNIDTDLMVLAWEDPSSETSYYLDLQTGCIQIVRPDLLEVDELIDMIEQNHDRYLYLPKADPKEVKEDLQDFVNSVEDSDLKRLLVVALEAPNPIISCRTIMTRKPELLESWEAFRSSRVRLRIYKWLAANFVTVKNQT